VNRTDENLLALGQDYRRGVTVTLNSFSQVLRLSKWRFLTGVYVLSSVMQLFVWLLHWKAKNFVCRGVIEV
jgi:hypothetical protein